MSVLTRPLNLRAFPMLSMSTPSPSRNGTTKCSVQARQCATPLILTQNPHLELSSVLL